MTLLVAASMVAALVGPVGPTCDAGLCAEIGPVFAGDPPRQECDD
ncbi:hypothetical protein AB0I60_10295 [Actinosynnema sp. NPDC050436]